MIHNIKSDKLTVRINDYGAELTSVKGADGFEYIWLGNPTYWDQRAPVLFPICGRILNGYYTYNGKKYEMDGHGFASKCSFKVRSKSEDRITLVLEADETTRKQYPFEFSLTATYTVAGDTLTATYTVENKDKKVMPYMLGWHPGFNLEGQGGSAIGDFTLKFNSGDTVVWYPLQHGCFCRPYGVDYALKNSEYALNEEEIYANDTMIFTGTGERALLSSPKEKHTVDMTWSKNLPYFCIWKETDAKARFICLEPWSGTPNDGETEENFNERKMERLASGGKEDYTYTVKFN